MGSIPFYPMEYPVSNSIISDVSYGYHPLQHMNPIISLNNTPAINPYFHSLVDVMRKRREKKAAHY